MNVPRVLLVDPIRSGRSVGLRHKHLLPHPGLGSLAAWLRSRGIEVRVFDGKIDPSSEALRRLLADFLPQVVGVTAFTYEIADANDAACLAKRVLPGVVTVVGGIHATQVPRETLRECPGFDLAVMGEGEQALEDIAVTAAQPERWAAIPSLAFRDGAGVTLTAPRPAPAGLDVLPAPAWDLFPLARYDGFAFGGQPAGKGDREFTVELTRGCPNTCTFCGHAVRYRRGAAKPVPRAIDEIESLCRRYGAKRVWFHADTFTLDRSYVVELCTALIAAGLERRITWGCTTRVDRVDPELARLMSAAGCRWVGLGIESGSPRILKAVHKEYDLGEAIANVRAMRAAGIWVMSNFILGFPDETRSEMQQTLDLAMRLDLDAASFGILIPFPGTRIAREIEDSPDLAITSREWRRYDPHLGADLIQRRYLSARDVLLFDQWANVRFWLRPGYFPKLFRFVSLSSALDHALFLARQTIGLTGRARSRSPALHRGACE